MVAALAGVAAVALLLPVVTGVPWGVVGDAVAHVPGWALPVLPVLWAAGLTAHTITLTAALPGLTHRRALLLSLTGSAVANVLPLGGAAGIALNHRMTRRWGFDGTAFASYTVVTNLWDVLAKLVLPVVAVPLVASALPGGAGVGRLLVLAAAALALVGIGAGRLLLRERPVPWLRGRPARWVERVRGAAGSVVRTAWPRLSLGMTLYTLLLLALLVACLAATGAGVPLAVVVVAFCGERIATLAGITPGGLGLVEVGLVAALLVAPGASAAGVAAGVVLYRALTFVLEIPVGGLLLVAWWWRQRGAA